MIEPNIDPEDYAVLHPDGKVILSPKIMADYVFETPGCELWQNKKDNTFGLKLLRGEDHPPYPIIRDTGSDGRLQGILDASPFFSKIGYEPRPEPQRLPSWFFRKFHMLVIGFENTVPQPAEPKPGIFDDFPALED